MRRSGVTGAPDVSRATSAHPSTGYDGTMEARARCERLAAKQHGALAHRQARACGLPQRTIGNLTATGRWRRLYPGVYLVGGPPRPPWESLLMGAVLWGGPGAVASGRSTAALFSIEGCPPGPIEITTKTRKKPLAGVRVRWDASLPDRPQLLYDGIPSVSIERAALELCGELERAEAERFLARLLRQRSSVPRLMRAATEIGGRGKKGTATLRYLLRTRFAHGVTDSEGEDLFAALCKKWGLVVVHHHIVRSGRFKAELDFALLDALIDIEIDGGDHENPEQRQHDRVRDQRLAALGWVVLRFNYWQLVFEPDSVRATIEDVLRRRRELLG